MLSKQDYAVRDIPLTLLFYKSYHFSVILQTTEERLTGYDGKAAGSID
jgi:hypothetical protein